MLVYFSFMFLIAFWFSWGGHSRGDPRQLFWCFRRPLGRSLGEIRFGLMRSSLTFFSGNSRPKIRKNFRNFFLRATDVVDFTDTNPEALREKRSIRELGRPGSSAAF